MLLEIAGAQSPQFLMACSQSSWPDSLHD